jgi:hypothetical protein
VSAALNSLLRQCYDDSQALNTVGLDDDDDDAALSTVSHESGSTKVGTSVIDTLKGQKCRGLEHLFGNNEELVNTEDTMHVFDVMSTIQKVLDVPLVAVSAAGADRVYLRTPGDMFVERRPIFGSFLDWVSTIGYSISVDAGIDKNAGDGEDVEEAGSDWNNNQLDSQDQDGTLQVEDTLNHPVFSKNMYCRRVPHVRSVCSAPIYVTHGGRTFLGGYVCVMDRIDRTFANKRFMKAFASVLAPYMSEHPCTCSEKGCCACEHLVPEVHESPKLRRHELLGELFDKWHIPLEICHQGVVMYRNQQYIRLQGMNSGASADESSLEPLTSPDIVSVPLFEYNHGDNDCLRASVELCSMLILCSPTFSPHDDVGNPYTLQYDKGALRMEEIDELVCEIDGVENIRRAAPRTFWCDCCDLYRNYECTYKGHPALIEAIKYVVATEQALQAYSRSWVRSMESGSKQLHHNNILQTLSCGLFGPDEHPKGNWIIQTTTMMPLSDAIYTSFNGMLKPLYVALTALDIARGLQHVHNMGMVYQDLNSSRIYLQTDASDTLRGWKAVLSLPDMIDNVTMRDLGVDQAVYTSCPHRSRRSCPEKVLGCRSSFRSESFEFGILLWEMWEGMPIWPQVRHDEGLLAIICYEKQVLGCSSRMPTPLRTIFHRCIGYWNHATISNETIITMLQDWISQLLRNTPEHK